MQTTTFISSSLFLALADPTSMFSTAVGWICKIAYLLALIAFISGVAKIKHEPAEGGTTIVIAILFAASAAIVNYFFQKAGMPTIDIGQ